MNELHLPAEYRGDQTPYSIFCDQLVEIDRAEEARFRPAVPRGAASRRPCEVEGCARTVSGFRYARCVDHRWR